MQVWGDTDRLKIILLLSCRWKKMISKIVHLYKRTNKRIRPVLGLWVFLFSCKELIIKSIAWFNKWFVHLYYYNTTVSHNNLIQRTTFLSSWLMFIDCSLLQQSHIILGSYLLIKLILMYLNKTMFLILYVFTLESFMPVAMHGHDPSLL
jgi:hypothetical protein